MARSRDGDQAGIRKFVDEGSRTLRGEKFALLAPEKQEGLVDLAQVGRWARRHAEPTRVELETPTPILLRANRLFRDLAEQPRIHVSGGRDDPIAVDGLLPGGIGPAQGESEASHPARSPTTSPGEVQQDDPAGFGMPGRVIQGDLGSHGVSHQGDRVRAQVSAERLEVGVEGSYFEFFRVVGVTVAAKIQRDDVMLPGKISGDVIPPMGVGTSSMKEHERGAFRLPPGEKVQGYSGLRRILESFASGFHCGGRYPDIGDDSTLARKPLFIPRPWVDSREEFTLGRRAGSGFRAPASPPG